MSAATGPHGARFAATEGSAPSAAQRDILPIAADHVARCGQRGEEAESSRLSSLSFLQGWELFHASWLRYATLLTEDGLLAEDVVQEAVTATLRARPDFVGVGAVDRYVREAIRTTAWRLLRKRRREVGPDDGGAPGVDPTSTGASPEELAIRAESSRRLCRVLHTLPQEERDAFLLHYGVSGSLTLDAIARRQGVSARAVSNRIQRVRAKLLCCLEGATPRTRG